MYHFQFSILMYDHKKINVLCIQPTVHGSMQYGTLQLYNGPQPPRTVVVYKSAANRQHYSTLMIQYTGCD